MQYFCHNWGSNRSNDDKSYGFVKYVIDEIDESIELISSNSSAYVAWKSIAMSAQSQVKCITMIILYSLLYK